LILADIFPFLLTALNEPLSKHLVIVGSLTLKFLSAISVVDVNNLIVNKEKSILSFSTLTINLAGYFIFSITTKIFTFCLLIVELLSICPAVKINEESLLLSPLESNTYIEVPV